MSGQLRMERRWGRAMAAPAVAGFVLFLVGPMVASLVIGLTDWTIGSPPRFVGFDNFATMLGSDPLFWQSAGATLYYAILAVPLTLLVGFFIALLLNQTFRGRGFFRTIYYLPVLVPSVASAILWTWIYNPDFGLLNSVLREVGLPTSQWIYGAATAVPSLAAMTAWGFGNVAIIFLAGLQSVPQHLYEAMDVDGGNAWHKLRYVTLPMMTPTILYNLVMGLIAAFQIFNEAYLMTQGGPGNATLFWVYYIYRTAFGESRLGYACALSWGLFLVVAIATALVFRTARRWVFYLSGDEA
ncbi:MAG: ABC transporter permease subunit [Streptosporangiales bacterium]|nr:ABC transporter permease subunit [Streptosporangiales bacterium]